MRDVIKLTIVNYHAELLPTVEKGYFFANVFYTAYEQVKHIKRFKRPELSAATPCTP